MRRFFFGMSSFLLNFSVSNISQVSSSDQSAYFKDSSPRHRTVSVKVQHNSTGLDESPTRITVSFNFTAQRTQPHPLSINNRHCVAISRGPFIYCVESVDNEHIPDLRAIRVPDDAEFRAVVDEGGLFFPALRNAPWKPVILKTYVRLVRDDILGAPGGGENSGGRVAGKGDVEPRVPLTLIPYFMWANRGKSNLRVWLPRVGED